MRAGLPRSSNDFRLVDLVRTFLGMGDGLIPSILLPTVPSWRKLPMVPRLLPMVARLEEQPILVLGHYRRLRHHLPYTLHSRHQHRGLQAEGYQLGVGYRHRRVSSVLRWL